MDIQYITDKKGKKNAVLLPISDWDKKYFMLELKNALDEVMLSKEGKLKLQTAKEFLDEL